MIRIVSLPRCSNRVAGGAFEGNEHLSAGIDHILARPFPQQNAEIVAGADRVDIRRGDPSLFCGKSAQGTG